DFNPGILADSQRFILIRNSANAISRNLEKLRDQVPQALLVLHDKYGLGTLLRRARGSCFDFVRLSDQTRQVDIKERPDADFAVNPDIASALLYDSVDGCQPETRAMARFLRGEERLEDMRPGLGIHAVACVTHHHLHVLAGRHTEVSGRILIGENDV